MGYWSIGPLHLAGLHGVCLTYPFFTPFTGMVLLIPFAQMKPVKCPRRLLPATGPPNSSVTSKVNK